MVFSFNQKIEEIKVVDKKGENKYIRKLNVGLYSSHSSFLFVLSKLNFQVILWLYILFSLLYFLNYRGNWCSSGFYGYFIC